MANSASFTFDPAGYQVPLGRSAALVVVQRYDGRGNYAALPNVRCLQVDQREGEPGTARFRYVLDDRQSSQYPDSFADLVPIQSSGPYVLQVDDRLVVAAISPDTGAIAFLFDGFVASPEVRAAENSVSAGFIAQGVAIRCWDTPLAGAVYRDGDVPASNSAGVPTVFPIRFNPNDEFLPIANATPMGWDQARSDGSTGFYPLFVQPSITGSPGDTLESQDAEDTAELAGADDSSPAADAAVSGDTRRFWTAGMAARYIIHTGCPDQTYVAVPDTSTLDSTLQEITPGAVGNVASDIVVRDFDATNMPWPEALKALLWPQGFRFRFDLAASPRGNPYTTLQVYRTDMQLSASPKQLSLQDGGILDPTATNTGSFNILRDTIETFNAASIEVDPPLVEAPFVLSPGFMISPSDAPVPARLAFTKAKQLSAKGAARNKYRIWIYDELGDGHWDMAGRSWSTKPGARLSTVRVYLPGRNELVSTVDGTSTGVPLMSQLDFSRDYAGGGGKVWDGTGNWQPVPGGWRLLKHRLGILCTADDPNAWPIGTPAPGNAQNSGKILNVVESLAMPSSANLPIYFRLTTAVTFQTASPNAIESPINAFAGRRPGSPRRFSVTTRFEGRDHYRKELVLSTSPNANPNALDPSGNFNVYRDDTSRAIAHARSLRSANEMGKFAGSPTIRRLSTAYDVGDAISGISGVGASFQTNSASQAGEIPTYPIISAITYDFADGQSTTLELSDDRATPRQP